MPRKTTTPKAAAKAPEADPLADLREPEDQADRYPATDAQEGPGGPDDTQVADALTEAVRSVLYPLLSDFLDAADVPSPWDEDETGKRVDSVTEAVRHHAAPPVDVSLIVERWHADRTSLRFLHGGGVCGCNWIATQAVGG